MLLGKTVEREPVAEESELVPGHFQDGYRRGGSGWRNSLSELDHHLADDRAHLAFGIAQSQLGFNVVEEAHQQGGERSQGDAHDHDGDRQLGEGHAPLIVVEEFQHAHHGAGHLVELEDDQNTVPLAGTLMVADRENGFPFPRSFTHTFSTSHDPGSTVTDASPNAFG